MKLNNLDFSDCVLSERIAYARYTSLTVIADITTGEVSYKVHTDLRPKPFSKVADEYYEYLADKSYASLGEAISQFNTIHEAAEQGKLIHVTAI